MARITHIQTGAERAAGQSGQIHNDTLADLDARMNATAARIAARSAETKARIEAIRADNARTRPRT